MSSYTHLQILDSLGDLPFVSHDYVETCEHELGHRSYDDFLKLPFEEKLALSERVYLLHSQMYYASDFALGFYSPSDVIRMMFIRDEISGEVARAYCRYGALVTVDDEKRYVADMCVFFSEFTFSENGRIFDCLLSFVGNSGEEFTMRYKNPTPQNYQRWIDDEDFLRTLFSSMGSTDGTSGVPSTTSSCDIFSQSGFVFSEELLLHHREEKVWKQNPIYSNKLRSSAAKSRRNHTLEPEVFELEKQRVARYLRKLQQQPEMVKQSGKRVAVACDKPVAKGKRRDSDEVVKHRFSSPLIPRLERRAKREVQQRAAAAEELKKQRQTISKRERASAILTSHFEKIKLESWPLRDECGDVLSTLVDNDERADSGEEFSSYANACFKSAMHKIRDKFGISDVSKQSGKHVAAGIVGCIGVNMLFRLFNKVMKASDSAVDLMSTINAEMLLLKHKLGNLWRLPFAIVIYFILTQCTELSPLQRTLVAGLLPTLFGGFSKNIGKFFRCADIQTQSMGNMRTYAKMLTTLITFSAFKRGVSANTINDFVRRISNLDRVAQGWESFIGWTMDAIEALVNTIARWIGTNRSIDFRKHLKPVRTWFKDIEEEWKNTRFDGIQPGPDTLTKWQQLAKDGLKYIDMFRGTDMERYCREGHGRIELLIKSSVGVFNTKNNYRPEPEFVLLRGAPGIGKTLVMSTFVSTVLIRAGLANPANVEGQMWGGKGTSEYWESYVGQAAIVEDDAFQLRQDATTPENDFMKIIRMIGPWGYPLNMANVEDKGKYTFCSKLIVATTNAKSLVSAAELCVYFPEAVLRRIHHGYEMILNPDFKDAHGRLDYDKYTDELERCRSSGKGIYAYPWHIWELQPYDFGNGCQNGRRIKFADLVNLVVARLKKKLKIHEDERSALRDYVDGLRDDDVEPQTGKVLDDVQQFVGGVASSFSDGIDSDCEGDRSRFLEGAFWEDVAKRLSGDSLSGAKRGWKENLFKRAMEAYNCALETFNPKRLSGDSGFVLFLKLIGLGFGFNFVFTNVRSLVCKVMELVTALFGSISTLLFGRNLAVETQSNRPDTRGVGRVIKTARTQAGDVNPGRNAYYNTYKVYTNFNDNDLFIIGQVMFLNNHLAVCPEHFTSDLMQKLQSKSITLDSQLRFVSSQTTMPHFSFSVAQFMAFRRVTYANMDLDFIQFPSTIRAHRNIVGSFVRESDLKHLANTRVELKVCNIDNNKGLSGTAEMVNREANVNYRNRPIYYQGRSLQRYLEYQLNTSGGDCGAPLCIINNSSTQGRTVLGYHVAGDIKRGIGYSAVVTQELVRKVMSEFREIDDCCAEDLVERGILADVNAQCGYELPFRQSGTFMPLWCVEPSKAPNICPNTSFFMTELYGEFGEYRYSPAHLRPVDVDGVKVWPMENAVKPYAGPLLHIDEDYMDLCVSIAMRPFSQKTCGVEPKLYTFEEAVLGIPQRKFRSIPRATAAGYPYNLSGVSGKKLFFGDGDEYDLHTPACVELRERVQYVLDSAAESRRLSVIFMDFLKDELRSESKNSQVATRLISSAPLDYTIAVRMMFGDFCASIMEHNVDTGLAPGICTYTDWDRLAMKLQSKGDKVFAGDFKGFDTSLQPSVMSSILRYINKWYDDGSRNARIREVLWADLCHSRHIGGLGNNQVFIYQWFRSLPSGHPLTTIVNSIYSLSLLVAVYVDLTGDLAGFWNNVFSITYGDDNASNVHDSVSHLFNQVTVAAAMAKYGMVYTSDKKEAELQETTTIDQITFLKRRFLLDNNYWNAPLELDSFLYTVYWCKNRLLWPKIRIDNLELALEELSLHEEETWCKWAPVIVAVMRTYDHVPRLPNARRSDYLRLVRSRSDSWY